MSLKKVANIQYQFDDNGDGTMEPNRTQIFVSNDCSASRVCALDIEHKNLVPVRFMDSKGPYLIYHPIRQSLQDFVIHWRNNKPDRDYIMQYNVPSERGSIRLRYFHPHGRSLLRHMLKFIVDQHAANRSLEPFTLNNLSIMGDVVKFNRIGFRTATCQSRRQDFHCIFAILKQIFVPVELYPKDLQDLCHRMTSNAFLGPTDGKWLANHLSIMSPREVLAFIVNCSEKVDMLSPTSRIDFDDSLDSVAGCYNWHTFFDDPTFHYLKKCLQNGRYITHGRTSIKVKKSMVRSLRNMVVHVSEVVRKDGKKVDEVGINLLMMEAIGAKLVELQERLASFNVLDEIL